MAGVNQEEGQNSAGYVPIVHRSCSRDENDMSISTTFLGSQSSLKSHRIPISVRRGGVTRINVSRIICLW